MIQNPASFIPAHTSPSKLGELTNPMNAYFDPLKCAIRLLSSPVSRCLNIIGLPDGVALPLMMKDVQGKANDIEKSAIISKNIFFMI